MPIELNQPPNHNEIMNMTGSMFNDTAQMIFNADYIGFSSKLTNSTTPNLKNVKYSTFTSDDADINFGFDYDSTNDLYQTPDIDNVEYIIIEATSLTSPLVANDVKTLKIASGKWLVYCTVGTDAVRRAQIHKSLWFGTSGSNQLILDFSSVTAVKTSHANDVGKQAHYSHADDSSVIDITVTYTGTFANTSTNTNCSSWSNVVGSFPSGGPGETSDEIGTDRSGDEKNNPADSQLSHTDASLSFDIRWEIPEGTTVNQVDQTGGSGPDTESNLEVIILCEGDITWVNSGFENVSNIDFFTDNSIPVFTAAGNASTEGFDVSTLIFKDTITSTDNAIAVINSTIDATSSEQISISANGGSNFTNVNNTEIARPVAGTALWRRIVITRTDLTKLDKVTEQACKYEFY